MNNQNHEDRVKNAKDIKDGFNNYMKRLASMDNEFLDDGKYRIYLKFSNGRNAQIEHLDSLSNTDLEEIGYIHSCSHVNLKKFWTAISASIVFFIAFTFSFKNKNGEKINLILRRCPEDEHASDDFVDDILDGLQVELKGMIDDEWKEEIEDRFDNLERLIKKLIGNSAETNSSQPRKRVIRKK